MFHTVWLTAWLTALPMKTNGGGTCDGEKGPADCMEDLAGGIHDNWEGEVGERVLYECECEERPGDACGVENIAGWRPQGRPRRCLRSSPGKSVA